MLGREHSRFAQAQVLFDQAVKIKGACLEQAFHRRGDAWNSTKRGTGMRSIMSFLMPVGSIVDTWLRVRGMIDLTTLDLLVSRLSKPQKRQTPRAVKLSTSQGMALAGNRASPEW